MRSCARTIRPFLILTSLSSGPKHGHALLLDIESFAGARLGPGTLYGAITRLEQRGLIEPLDADDRRRPYRITAAGSECAECGARRSAQARRRGNLAIAGGAGVSAWLLRAYPAAWRERYGDELVSLIEAGSDGGRISVRVALDVVGAGLAQRLRSAGLAGDDVPPDRRIRAGVLLVLSAWAAFVVAGLGFAKTAEHWQAVTPQPDRGVPAAAYDGVLLASRARDARGPARDRARRLGRWSRSCARVAGTMIHRPVLRAFGATGLTAVVLLGVVVWAHRLTIAQRNGGDVLYGGACLVARRLRGIASIGLWTRAAVVTAQRARAERRVAPVGDVPGGGDDRDDGGDDRRRRRSGGRPSPARPRCACSA